MRVALQASQPDILLILLRYVLLNFQSNFDDVKYVPANADLDSFIIIGNVEVQI